MTITLPNIVRALIAALITGLGMASLAVHAGENTITFYGNANLSVESTDPGGTGAQGRRTSVSDNSSALGIAGEEALGNGLSAIFQIEVDADGIDGGSAPGAPLFGAGGNTFAGLAGAFGSIALGNHDTPYATSIGDLDPFSDTIADNNAILGNAQGSSLYESAGNSIIYLAPEINGLGAHFQYSFDETAGSHSDIWGAQAHYSNGPLYLSYGHETQKGADAGNTNRSADVLGAGYTVAATTLSAVYEVLRSDATGSTADRNAWHVGLAHNVGNNTFKLAYARAANSAADANDGAYYWAAGLSHNLSKRTELFGLYARTSNDSNGAYGLGQTGSGGAVGGADVPAGANVDSFAVGMKHGF